MVIPKSFVATIALAALSALLAWSWTIEARVTRIEAQLDYYHGKDRGQ